MTHMKCELSLLPGLWFAVAWICLAQTISAASAGSSPENQAFAAALKSFAGGWWERAESEFAQFTQQYPASERRAEAILRQAQALYRLTNSVGAEQLLSANIE